MAQGDVERVKERTDIVALVGEHVRLKRTGTNFKGLCPFHGEKTPSFIVSPNRQMYHCFGCGESGDAFSWLMKREGMTFPEALRVLAQRAGIQLTFERAERHEERDRLRATLSTAADFYHVILLKTSAARDAREYLAKRGITDASIEKWRIGYVPLNTTPIIEKAGQRGVTRDDLFRVGILGQGPRGPYERFYGRVLFPLTDAHGSVVGFAGRILKEDPARPVGKYINSPETTLYVKGRVLYGLDFARDAIRRETFAVVVEGYTDVIASHQTGIENVVATSGTALTDDHLAILKRFTDHVVFAFDADAAGQEATRRAIDLALAAGFTVSAVVLPTGDDPADLAIRDPERWRQAIAQRQDAFMLLLDRARTGTDLRDTAAKKALGRDLLPLLVRIPDAVVRGDYLQKLAGTLALEVRFLQEDLDRYRAFDDGAARPSPVASAESPTVLNPLIRREERLLTLLIASPESFPLVAENLPTHTFVGPQTRVLYEALTSWYDRTRATGAPIEFQSMRETLPDDLRRLFDVLRLTVEIEQEEGLLEQPDRDARILLRELLVAHLRHRLTTLTGELATVPADRHPALLQDITQLTERLLHADHLTSSS